MVAVLEADYSTALAILLHYPQPSTPPSDFVKDALYLRDNLTPDGGSSIAFQYLKRRISVHEATPNPLRPNKRSKRGIVPSRTPRLSNALAPRPRDVTRVTLPLPSAARYIREQGGVEGLIKGAFGELKKNVQTLQIGSPPRQPAVSVSSEDFNIRGLLQTQRDMTAKLTSLEARSKHLAKLLDDSLADLWAHQKVVAEDRSHIDVDRLSQAIAKVQLVRIHLEDPDMPISWSADAQQPRTDDVQPAIDAVKAPDVVSASAEGATRRMSQHRDDQTIPVSKILHGGTKDQAATSAQQPQSNSTGITQQSRFHQPRPSLAQSSFSWMLGEDGQRFSFVEASPFSPETKKDMNARGKAGFLFGDDYNGTANGPQSPTDTEPEKIVLGTLKGRTLRLAGDD